MVSLLFGPDFPIAHLLSPSLLSSGEYVTKAPLWFWLLLVVGILLELRVNLLVKPVLAIIFIYQP
jgi:hypothetical protein